MTWIRSKLLLSLSLLVLCSVPASPDTSPGTLSEEQRQTLARLAEISIELEQSNARLKNALESSAQSYRRLERLHEKAQSELRRLQASLQTVERRLTASEKESVELGVRLVKARTSLRSLERELTNLEAALRRARFERWLWALAGLGIGAAGGVGASAILQ